MLVQLTISWCAPSPATFEMTMLEGFSCVVALQPPPTTFESGLHVTGRIRCALCLRRRREAAPEEAQSRHSTTRQTLIATGPENGGTSPRTTTLLTSGG